MILFVFLLVAITGVILLISVIVFYNGTVQKQVESAKSVSATEVRKEENQKQKKGENALYLPVQKIDRQLPGIKKGELIHFFGEAVLYSVESAADISELDINKSELQEELDGNLAITSQWLLVFHESSVKKMPLRMIEGYRFYESYVIIKRKNVKKKKDVLQIKEKQGELKYIFQVLM